MDVAINNNGIKRSIKDGIGGCLHQAIHRQHGNKIDQEYKTPEQPLQLHGTRLAGKYLHN